MSTTTDLIGISKSAVARFRGSRMQTRSRWKHRNRYL